MNVGLPGSNSEGTMLAVTQAQGQPLPAMEESGAMAQLLEQLMRAGTSVPPGSALPAVTAQKDGADAEPDAGTGALEPLHVENTLAPIAADLAPLTAFAPAMRSMAPHWIETAQEPARQALHSQVAAVMSKAPAPLSVAETSRGAMPAVASGVQAHLAFVAADSSLDAPEGGALSSFQSLPALVASERTDSPLAREVAAVPVPVSKGAQPLVQALAQRIQLQQSQGADVATVRLDPPQMGSLEIRIRHDAAGAVQVHMQASHTEVGRQLLTVVEHLRQELQQRSTEAQVTVAHSRGTSAGNPQGEQSRQQSPQHSEEPVIGQALRSGDGSALS